MIAILDDVNGFWKTTEVPGTVPPPNLLVIDRRSTNAKPVPETAIIDFVYYGMDGDVAMYREVVCRNLTVT